MGGGERHLEKKRPHLSGPTGKLFLVLSTQCSINQSCEVEEQTGGCQNRRSGGLLVPKPCGSCSVPKDTETPPCRA